MQKVYDKLLNIVRLVLYSNDAVILIFVHQQNERVSSLYTFVNPRFDGSKQNCHINGGKPDSMSCL